MAEWAGKFLGRLFFFVFAFFLLYSFSFIIGLKLVEPFFKGTINHPIRNLFYGCFLASFLSLIVTVCIHIIYKYLFRSLNFSSWFRSVNLVFLYLSGLGTAIVTMKGLLVKESLITGDEIIFNDQFKLMGMIFFIALFNYNAYNSLVLTREVIVLDWIQARYRIWKSKV
ncbi:hypothetical protein FHR92_003071 [Fontibacillus solani]|uniref:Uncharacterized protein n=1 Tax=Fontibacillus solani TaxID=1572857 RepID=A0A7W3SUP1_9BACL|nr:hypothetical protein [Fontibacillus solani]MBA9086591.1 hypothetical protein [Fontibacillus solani]